LACQHHSTGELKTLYYWTISEQIYQILSPYNNLLINFIIPSFFFFIVSVYDVALHLKPPTNQAIQYFNCKTVNDNSDSDINTSFGVIST
jgi:hypothetical protein